MLYKPTAVSNHVGDRGQARPSCEEEREKGVVGPPELIPRWTMSVDLLLSLRELPSR